MRTIYSATDGRQIPVTRDLNVQPLTLCGKPVTNGRGEPVMNDRWMMVDGVAINVYRAHYCQKMYMAEITIQESIGNEKLMTADLKLFIEKVSDKLVFQKYGRWYRVYLRKITQRTFDIAKVVPYNWTIAQNMEVGGKYAHQCCIDWRSTFYI